MTKAEKAKTRRYQELARRLKMPGAFLCVECIKAPRLTDIQADLVEFILDGLPNNGDFLGENIDDELNQAKDAWDPEFVNTECEDEESEDKEREAALKWAADAGRDFIWSAHSARESHGSRGLAKFMAWAKKKR